MNQGDRYCPICDRTTPAALCPVDGVETIDLSGPAPTFDEPAIGQIIAGRYRTDDILGRGGMGTVFAATQLSVRRRIALKVLVRDVDPGRVAFKRFYLEARATSALDHPNIVRLFDFGVDPATRLPFIAMELVEGRTLRAVLSAAGPLPERGAARLLAQVASALACAHRAGILHRDLKPENIVVSGAPGDELARVLDFGIAKLVAADQPQTESITEAGTLIGTPLYMSPEQARREPIDERSDLYSLGCVLQEALSGSPPFTARSAVEILVKHARDVPSPLPETLADGERPSAAILELVGSLLAKRREDRPADATLVANALADLGRGVEPEARGATAIDVARNEPPIETPQADAFAPTVVRRPAKARTWLGWTLAAALLAAAAGWAWWESGRLPSGERVVLVAAEGGDDASVRDVLAPMARRRVEKLLPTTTNPAAASVRIELDHRLVNGGIEIDASVGPARGRMRPSCRARGESVAEALDRALEPVLAEIAGDAPERKPSAAEIEEMRLLGTGSYRAYRLYLEAVTLCLGTIIQAPEVVSVIERGLATDPGWAHMHGIHVIALGFGSPSANAALSRGRRESDPSRDPRGRALLDAMAALVTGTSTRSVAAIDQAYRDAPNDVLVGFGLGRGLLASDRTEDAIGVLREIHLARPDLQFGADLATALRAAGRGAEVPALMSRWVAVAPDSEQALAMFIAAELEAGGRDRAVAAAKRILFLFGESPPRMLTLAEALLAAERVDDVKEIADRLLRSGPTEPYARWVRGEAAVLEGRFAGALESFLAAAYGVESGPGAVRPEHVILGSARAIAASMGRMEDARRASIMLADHLTRFGYAAESAAERFELALLERGTGPCPSLEVAVGRIPEGPGREIGRIHMLRAAAAHGCAPCADVVVAGRASKERSTESLFRFAACAQAEGRLEMAEQLFASLRSIRTPSIHGSTQRWSVYYAILSRYRLAQVLEARGERPRARAEYEAFLARWSEADRPMTEIDDARAALARLQVH